MKQTDSSIRQVSSPGWQILGELELTVSPDPDRTVSQWLTMILTPLNLHSEFVSKVLKSAQEVAARALQTGTMTGFQHTHLYIIAPKDHASHGHNWGFFRIEKVEDAADQVDPGHSIEFYLYPEGQ